MKSQFKQFNTLFMVINILLCGASLHASENTLRSRMLALENKNNNAVQPYKHESIKSRILAQTKMLEKPIINIPQDKPLIIMDENGFSVLKDGTLYPVENGFVDPLIRDQSKEEIVEALSKGLIRFNINELQGGNSPEFTIRANCNLDGGGVAGGTIGFYLGKFLVYGVANTLIGITSVPLMIVCPPAGAVWHASALGALAIPIEATSNVVGIGLGIAGAAASGPV